MLYTISRRHGVPARKGGQVRFKDVTGRSFTGTIIGAVGANLKVQFRGIAGCKPIHPEWNVEYL